MKKIDIHCHVVAFPEYSTKRLDGNKYLSVEEQLVVHRKLDVDLGVLLPITTQEAHWATISNEAAQYVANRYPDKFVWFCSVDPRQGRNNAKSDLGYIINQYKELGARGVGELGTQMYADDPMMQNLFYYSEELDMPVLIHVAPQHGDTYGIVDDPGLPRLEKMLRKFPKLKIIGHSAALWCEISENIVEAERDGYPKGKVKEGRLPKLMREYGNLYCDLSAGSGQTQ
ncbi:MAG: amidohydrolase family protein [Oscillospiraceae bacterium]|nr:amidohydrolase family protein [Oscillospiraceae bacterium]